MSGKSVVVDDFNFVRAVGFPTETDAPLIIDSNGVKTLPIALEGFQSIAGWDGELDEFGDSVQLGELPQSNTLDGGWNGPDFPLFEKELGLL
jgi:hypothetical protein